MCIAFLRRSLIPTSLFLLASLAAGSAGQTADSSPVLLIDIDGAEVYRSTTSAIAQAPVLLGALPSGVAAADLDSIGRTLWIVRPTPSGSAEAGTIDLDTLEYVVRGRNQPFATAGDITASPDGHGWYAVQAAGSLGGDARIFKGDLFHGRMTELVTLANVGPITGLAAGLNGELYAFADDTDEVLTLDGRDGTVIQRVTASLSGEAIGLDVDYSTGALVCHYRRASVSSFFAEIDPSTGLVTPMDDLVMLGFAPKVAVQRSGRILDVVSLCGTPVPNVTGEPGSLSARGSRQLEHNDLTLVATSLPPGTFGLLLASQTVGQAITPPGSIGGLCLSGAVGRIAMPGGLLPTGPDGTFSATLDLDAIPQPMGPQAVVAWESWAFQGWFRDSLQGVPTSNFTDAIQVSFQEPNAGPKFLTHSSVLSGRVVLYQDVTGDGTDELVTIANQTGLGAFEAFEVDEHGVPTQSLGATYLNWNGVVHFEDLNADGHIDAVAGTRSSRVAVLIGDGAGAFTEVDRIEGCTSLHSLDVVDADGDGTLDIFFGCGGRDACGIMYGLPTGGFAATEQIPVPGFKPRSAFLRDLSGDGLPDLVYLGGQLANRFGYAVNLGQRTFDAPWITPGTGDGTNSFMEDIDGDGRDELVVSYSGLIRTYFKSDTSPGFLSPGGFAMPGLGRVESVGDLDGDGLADARAFSSSGAADGLADFNFLRGGGDGQFSPTVLARYPYASLGTVGRPRAGGPEVLAARFGQVLEFVPLATSSFNAGVYRSSAFGSPRNNQEEDRQPVVLKDVTGDGVVDAIFGTASLTSSSVTIGSLRMMEGLGDGRFASGQEIAQILARAVEVVDVDADGDLDVLAASDGALTGIRIYLNGGTGSFVFGGEVPLASADIALATGEFTGDALLDIVVAVESGGLSLFAGLGNGFFSSEAIVTSAIRYDSLVVADFDLDGHDDIAASSGGAESVSMFYGGGTAGLAQPVPVGDGGEEMVAVDVDADGVPDLATIGMERLVVYLTVPNRDFVRSETPVEREFSNGIQRLAGGDVDGDGFGDVLFISTQEGLVLFRSTGFGFLERDSVLGSITILGEVELSDLDGDGALDFCTTGRRTSELATYLNRAE